MVVLDQGVLSHFDCHQRMGVVFLGALILQSGVIITTIWRSRRTSDGYLLETLDDQPWLTRPRLIMTGIATFIVVLVSLLVMCTRTETLLSMDGMFITETSCIGPFSDEYRLDRAQVVVEHRVEDDETLSYNKWAFFRNFFTSRGRRHQEDNYLAISEAGRPRSLFIELLGRQNAPELVALSPDAMQHYSDHLQAVKAAHLNLD